MKTILRILGYCALWIILDIILLFVCYQVLEGQLWVEGIFRIAAITLIGLILRLTRNTNTFLITTLVTLFIAFNIYRMTGMLDQPQFSRGLIFYNTSTSILGLTCFFMLLYVPVTRAKSSLIFGTILLSLWLSYDVLFRQFLSIINKQETLSKTDGNSFILTPAFSDQPDFKTLSNNKIIVAALFTESCGFCFQEMKALQKLKQKINDTSIVFIGIHTLVPFDSAKMVSVKPFVPFPIYKDSGYLMKNFFNIKGVPHLVIMDRQGQVQFHKMGYNQMESDYLIQLLSDKLTELKTKDKLITGSNPPSASTLLAAPLLTCCSFRQH